jgi:hypothetical protein
MKRTRGFELALAIALLATAVAGSSAFADGWSTRSSFGGSWQAERAHGGYQAHARNPGEDWQATTDGGRNGGSWLKDRASFGRGERDTDDRQARFGQRDDYASSWCDRNEGARGARTSHGHRGKQGW